MSTIIDRLLGRKKRTSITISDELAVQAAVLVNARDRIDSAKTARETALDSLDKPGLKAATEAQADAENDVALAERAILALQTAQREALASEAREALRAEIVAYSADAKSLADRLVADYPEAARTINSIVQSLIALEDRRLKLENRASFLGEPAKLRNPEDVRQNAPVRWSAYWPNPDGDGVIKGPAADAPDDAVAWIDDRPVALRDDVRVEAIYPPVLPSLIHDTGDLPGLHAGDGRYHRQVDRPRLEPREYFTHTVL